MPVSYLGTQGILNGLNVGDPFFATLGATISERTYCDSGSCTAYAMTIGATAGVDPESLVHSKFILIWACNVHEHQPAPVAVHRRGRAGAAPRSSWSTRCAPAPRPPPTSTSRSGPGTDTALALAMMNVIIAEGLTDEAYVAEHTVGYAELVERVAPHTPEWAATETGVAGRRHPHPGPGVRRRAAVGDPDRGGRRAARRWRADRAGAVLPAGAGRGLAPGPAAGSCSCRCGRSR